MNGNKLRIELERKDISTKELADILNIHISSVQAWIRESSEPKTKTIADAVDYLKTVSLDYLMNRTGYETGYRNGKFDKEKVQEKLIDLRIKKGLEYDDLAKATGVSNVRDIEKSGAAKANIFAILCIADYYGVSLDWLVRDAK